MAWAFILILGGAAIWGALRWYAHADPALVKRGMAGFTLVFLALVVLALIFTGRFTAALPFLFGVYLAYSRLRQGWGLLTFFQRLWGATTQPGGAQSEIETDYLRLRLDKTTGALSGKVRKGPFAGQDLASLSQADAMHLYAFLRREDYESARLMETFMNRAFGTAWANRQAGDDAQEVKAPKSAAMTAADARDVLGLPVSPSREEILAAHKRLMKVVHPDQGGSDFLAQQINLARDILLQTSS